MPDYQAVSLGPGLFGQLNDAVPTIIFQKNFKFRRKKISKTKKISLYIYIILTRAYVCGTIASVCRLLGFDFWRFICVLLAFMALVGIVVHLVY